MIIASFVLLFATNIFAQEPVKINNGNHTVSFTGVFSTFMNWRDYAGIYTGVGEVVLTGTNDPSGSYEYVGRVEVSYPDKMPKSLFIIYLLKKLFF